MLASITFWASDGVAARETPAQPSAAGAVPPAGGITTTVAGSADARALLDSIPFNASTLMLFNVTTQYWMTYTPGGPDWLNQSFQDNLVKDALVWVRRAPEDSRGGISWEAPSSLGGLDAPQALPVPPAGRVTAGPAGTTNVEALVQQQDFRVRSVFAFDVARQRYVSYTPGAPAWVNTLAANGLQPSGTVWLSRDASDHQAIISSRPLLAAIGEVVAPKGNNAPSTSPSGGSSTGATVSQSPSDGGSTSTPSNASGETPSWRPPALVVKPPSSGPSASPSAAPTKVTGASMIRHLTYEDGERAMTSEQAPSGGIGRTKEQARSGSSAGYALLRPGDPKSHAGGYRAEWHGDDHIKGPGTERWHGISYYFPSDFNQGSNSATWNDRIIFQFCDQGSPMFSLHLDAKSQELWVRRKLPNRDSNGKPQFQTLARFPFETGKWYDIVFHAKWTKDGSGFFDVFVDGDQKVDYNGRTLAERDFTYSKWGIYGQPTHLYFDEVWTAEGSGTLESVRP